jgi:hypothetical protein
MLKSMVDGLSEFKVSAAVAAVDFSVLRKVASTDFVSGLPHDC